MRTRSTFVGAIVAGALALGSLAPAFAEGARFDVSAALFENKHFAAAAADQTLKYSYSRKSKDAEWTRPSFDDVVELKLEPGQKPDTRNIIATLFKGPMHRPAGPFDDVDFNPLVIMMLEYNLGDFAKILGANPRYLKNAIRAAMRDDAVATPVKITLQGKEVEATRIEMKPFAKEVQHRDTFRALVNTSYVFTVSDAVPGYLYRIEIVAPDPAGGDPVFQEVTQYVEN